MPPHLQGKAARDPRPLDAGDGADPLEHVVVEHVHLGRHEVHVLGRLVEVPRPAEQDVGGQQVPRVEAGQALLLAQEGAHHQAGAAAASRAASAPATLFQDLHEIDARGAQGGQETEDHARRAAELGQSEGLERAPILEKGLHDLPGGRLLGDPVLRLRAPEDHHPVHVLESQLVVRHLVDDAVHGGGRSHAEAEGKAGDDDQHRVALPEAQRESQVGEHTHR
jgi:hypothetical protein